MIPPSGSPLGVACSNGLSITIAGLSPTAGDPPQVASLVLPSKVSLTGTILNADGLPVSGVTISATRTAADPNTNCASSIVSAPTGDSSKEDGSYQLLVDPGVYRIDYDPPAGAPVPRLTETGVTVAAGDQLARTVQLARGALVMGAVQRAEGTPLSFVGVRFFDVVCSGRDACYGKNRVEPILRAETHTDSDGNFRAVVPIVP